MAIVGFWWVDVIAEWMDACCLSCKWKGSDVAGW